MARHNEVGTIGEDAAARFLMKRGYKILDRNYRQKWGEIDIIASYKKQLCFIEVKSVTRENLEIIHFTKNSHRPEDNVHYKKRQRLGRAIETYLLEKRGRTDVPWHFELIVAYVSFTLKKTKIHHIENIVL